MDKEVGSLSRKDIETIHSIYKQEIKNIKVNKFFGIIAFLDVLGWKKIATEKTIITYEVLAKNLQSKVNDLCFRFCSDLEESNFFIRVLSDTVVILSDSEGPINELNLFYKIREFIASALEKNIVFRGALSYGEYYVNADKNIFVGQPINEARKFMESTDWAGVILTDSLSKALLKNNKVDSLIQLGVVPYNKIPFKHKKIKCKDNLVLAPYKYTNVDYIEAYMNYMIGDKKVIRKRKNTIKFIKYIQQNYWDKLDSIR